jgi:hypothetical protein
MAGILDLFFGVPQSKYAGMAILVSLAAVGLSILFGKERVPFFQKLVVVGLLVLLSLPAMLVTLFQLTCMVTGAGLKNQRWWCSGYAWLVSALIVLYSVLLIVMTVLSFSAEWESKEVEKFYSTREGFQEMAEEYFEEKEEEEKTAVPTMPIAPPAGELPPIQPGVVPPVVPTAEQTGAAMPPAEAVAAAEPETFTSCGAPFQ